MKPTTQDTGTMKSAISRTNPGSSENTYGYLDRRHGELLSGRFWLAQGGVQGAIQIRSRNRINVHLDVAVELGCPL